MKKLWLEFFFVFSLTILFSLYLLLKPGDIRAIVPVDNIVQFLLEALGVILTLPLFLPQIEGCRKVLGNFCREMPSPRRWVPYIFGLGILSYVVGQGIWTYNEDIVKFPVLFPSWADVGYQGSYPFILLAILLLPSSLIHTGTRIRIVLDSMMIMVGIVTFSWYFILGPTILQGADSVLGQIVSVAYPLMTLVLIFCLLFLLLHSNDNTLRPVIFLLASALTIVIVTDTIYGYQELHNSYQTGSLLDVGWPLGYMLIGLGGRMMYLTPAQIIKAQPTTNNNRADQIIESASSWGTLLPYCFIPAVVLLLAFIQYSQAEGFLKIGVYMGVAILMVLLLVRQVVAAHETEMRKKQLQIMQQDVWKKNDALIQVNARLEQQASELEKAYEKQKYFNRMKDQFIVNVNHELRTPLTQVYGYLELLSDCQYKIDEGTKKIFITNAKNGCEELLFLVNNVLYVTHSTGEMPPPHCEEVAIDQMVHEICNQFVPEIGRRERFLVEIPAEMKVWADRHYIGQILRNLCSNALKYTPETSPIIIRAQRSIRTGTPQVCISVQDAGPGIPPDEKPLLFQKFVRLKRDISGTIRGTGLGLYISKQLVELMDGEIWLESSGQEGEGACFCFTLPACE